MGSTSIFRIACPPLVREFDTLSEYADIGKGSFFIVDSFTTQKLVDHFLTGQLSHSKQLKYFIKTFTKGEKVRGMDFSAWRDEAIPEEEQIIELNSRRPGTPVEIVQDKLPEAFWYARNAADESRKFVRRICMLLYVAGYTAFLIVSLQGFWYVLTA